MGSQNRLQHLANEVKKLLSDPSPPVTVEDPPPTKFIWTIQNFSRLLDTNKHYSDVFTLGAYKWRVLIFPKGNKVDHLSMYLDVADSADLPYGWRRCAMFSLAILNQIHNKCTVRKHTEHQFTAEESDWGFTSFMPLTEFYDPGRGHLLNDTCIVEAEVDICSVAEFMPVPEPQSEQGGKRSGPVTMRVAKSLVEVKLEKQVLQTSPQTVSLFKNPRAGQLFEEGIHRQMDEKYENIGGFSVLEAQASLYKLIWLKYGHIASSKVLSASYDAQVLMVSEIMKSIVEMHQVHLHELSTEILNTWEEKLRLAESLHFHVNWLRERLEDVKKDFQGMQKLENELERETPSLLDAQARVTKAGNEVKKLLAELVAAKDESVKARESKTTLESRLKPVLANVEICLGKGKLLDGFL